MKQTQYIMSEEGVEVQNWIMSKPNKTTANFIKGIGYGILAGFCISLVLIKVIGAT